MKYRVKYKAVSYMSLDVEANSIEEAKRIAEDSDGGEFAEENFGFWKYSYTEDEKGNIVDE